MHALMFQYLFEYIVKNFQLCLKPFENYIEKQRYFNLSKNVCANFSLILFVFI